MNNSPSKLGVVLSDLHWFARRSRAPRLMERIHAAADDADVLVLNGDTFDFNWTTRPSLETSVDEAERWIESLCGRHAGVRVCFIIGNHDYYKPFLDRLPGLAERLGNFEYHLYSLRLGRALFLHGDCATTRSTVNDVLAYRRTWHAGVRRGRAIGIVYSGLVWAKIIHLTHLIAFPRRVVIRRVTQWIERHHPGLLDQLDDIYFGHTHLPFSNVSQNGRRFHNTGSAIKTMPFNMMTFEYQDDRHPGHSEEGAATWKKELQRR